MHGIRTARRLGTKPEQAAIAVNFEAADLASVAVQAMQRTAGLVDEQTRGVVAGRNGPPMSPFPGARHVEDLQSPPTRAAQSGRSASDVRPKGDIGLLEMRECLHGLTLR
jgi:hypothetical protein